MAGVEDFLRGADDFAFEEEILRSPYSVSNWWAYLQSKAAAGTPSKARIVLYERAVKMLPGSYKLWHDYLTFQRHRARKRPVTHEVYAIVNNCFERALVFMNKMPVIWLEYCRFLASQGLVTRTRRTFDRALKALPPTQHKRLWELYVSWAKELGVWQTAVKVFRRYVKFDPRYREEFADFLLTTGHYDEACKQVASMVNDDHFISPKGRSKHAMWMQLCQVISKHPTDVTSIACEPIIRSGIRRFTDEVGQLWCALADYFIRLSLFEKARDVYEEAIQTVVTVRDFSMVFDAYVQFEETMLAAKMELQGDDGDDGDANGAANGVTVGKDGLADLAELDEAGDDVELRLARLEMLMEQRPVLLSSVLLRQNPHNVAEWHKRVKLFTDPVKAIQCYAEAVKTVDPMQATGKPHTLWCSFAQYYERHGSLNDARVIWKKAVEAKFRHVEDLASVWCEWAEMELRHDKYDRALDVMTQAVKEPKGRYVAPGAPRVKWADLPVQERVYKSIRLWSLYLDLEESLGTVESTKAAYNRCIDLRVATPQIVLNFAHFLEENKFYEDAFKAYERGVAVFPYPHVKEIWLEYLTKFVERYGGRQLERAREIFEQAVDGAPPEHAAPLFQLYAKLEEDFGLRRRAMSVYDRATKAVDAASLLTMYTAYLSKAEEMFGVTATRDIYERAIDALDDDNVVVVCLKFAAMERKLGELDRARAILVHASQFCDPRVKAGFWKEWEEFELAHGNEDTFREMLRVKRSVVAAFANVNLGVQELLEKAKAEEAEARAAKKRGREGGATGGLAALEAQAAAKARVEDEDGADGGAGADGGDAAEPVPIGLGEDIELEERAVPGAVFGETLEEAADKPVGALARFKQRA